MNQHERLEEELPAPEDIKPNKVIPIRAAHGIPSIDVKFAASDLLDERNKTRKIFQLEHMGIPNMKRLKIAPVDCEDSIEKFLQVLTIELRYFIYDIYTAMAALEARTNKSGATHGPVQDDKPLTGLAN